MAKGLPQNKLQQAYRSPSKQPPTHRKGRGLLKKFFFFLILGGVSGWLYANPEHWKLVSTEAKKIYQKVDPYLSPALEFVKPVLEYVEPVREQVKGYIPVSFRRILRLPATSLLRYFDSFIPLEYKDKAAEHLPFIFSYPYLCKISRIESTNPSGSETPAATKKISLQGPSQSQMVGIGTTIMPGNRILVSMQNQAEISCGLVKITISPGSQIHFLRGENDRKVLDVIGSISVVTNGAAAIAFALPFGEVEMDSIKNSSTALQFIVQKEQATINVTEGNAALVWRDGKIEDSQRKLLQVIAGSNTNLQMRVSSGAVMEARLLAPGKETALLASGSWSGLENAQKVMIPVSTPNKVASRAQMNNATSTQLPQVAQPTNISLVVPVVNAKTSGANNQIDVLLAWQENPEQRLVPCEVEMAADMNMKQILAKYKSAEMRLLLKGMRPGVYFWQVSCSVNAKNLKSTVGRIQIVDGRKLASVPILLSPNNNEQIKKAEVVYQWEKVETAKSYILQLSLDPNFKKFNEYHARSGTGLKMNLKKKGKYYWRVYGIRNSKEDRTGYSAIRAFIY